MEIQDKIVATSFLLLTFIIIGMTSFDFPEFYHHLSWLHLLSSLLLFSLLYKFSKSGIEISLKQLIIFRVLTMSVIAVNLLTFITSFLSVTIGLVFYGITLGLTSLLPLTYTLFLLSFQKVKVSVLNVLPSLYIGIYYIGMLILNPFTSFIGYTSNLGYTTMHPIALNYLLVVLAYTIFLLPHLKFLLQDRIRSGISSLVVLSLIIVWVLVPLLELNTQFSPYTIQAISATLELVGIYYLIFFHLRYPSLFFSYFSDNIKLLLVMNAAGLPVYTHDFRDTARPMENYIMFSGSFRAIFSLISTTIDGAQVKALNLTTGKLLIQTHSPLYFLLLVNKETDAIISSFHKFIEGFARRDFSLGASGMVDLIVDSELDLILTSCFGVRSSMVNYLVSPHPKS